MADPSPAARARTGLLGLILALVAVVLAATSVTAVVPGVNGLIAYTSLQDGNYEIYVMNPDGTGKSRLTNNPSTDESPSFSPDGASIAFMSNRTGFLHLHVMNADGTNQRRLLPASPNDPFELDRDPVYSPDGTSIAYSIFTDFFPTTSIG